MLEWEVLKKSSLEWTLVRPPRIVKGGRTGNISADDKNLASIQVNVEDLAHFMLDQISSKTWINKAPLVANE
jgi:putative NADH-flavin reductase